ncbi:MFS general substrate transporter [Schizophyllum commune H4-8]|uniref:MFS general substrate transporter n=1 Tax=Schizophyllum commune (strain H4-8 / FGSC 9210) TaxID=578458 RepID=UPI00215E1D2D|nr:MFS general substrate transporter [Schizophyllum commune H4-8]KAI5899096.1 MFS general substrate transporter [Schizophyllum commune H4-8]
MTSPNERQPLLEGNGASSTAPRRPGPRDISRSHRYGILAGVWAATLLSSLNGTLVPTMLPSISSEFKKSNQASWLGTSYLLATCTFTPLYGRLCNALGRRGANQTAVLACAIGTLACGLSTNMETLIVARFLAGIGGGGIFTTSTIVISDMYSLRSRGLAQGFASVFNGFGMGIGGPLGGFITDWLGWRWAFLLQLPIFVVSLVLTSINLTYETPYRNTKSTKDVLKRIDYLGSLTLLISVGSCLIFLSTRYNSILPWSDASVIVPCVFAVVFFILFILVELYVAKEPVLAPFLLKKKVPVLTGISNFLVANCNFSIMYFFPMWFQTVMLTSASTAGLHLLPNSVSMSTGSVFAGWVMHRTGRYKTLNAIFGIFPFVATIFISLMHEGMGPVQSWLSIIPLGFGNAVVLQTMLIALLAHLDEAHMAVGTGFGQLFRGIGQVGGVAISSALFQTRLDGELRRRIVDDDELVLRIRQSARLIHSLPPDIQRKARDAYDASLKSVFVYAAVMTFLAYVIRLPIPDKKLERHSPKPVDTPVASGASSVSAVPSEPVAAPQAIDIEDYDEEQDQVTDVEHATPRRGKRFRRLSSLSTYTSTYGSLDLEDDRIGGSARSL